MTLGGPEALANREADTPVNAKLKLYRTDKVMGGAHLLSSQTVPRNARASASGLPLRPRSPALRCLQAGWRLDDADLRPDGVDVHIPAAMGSPVVLARPGGRTARLASVRARAFPILLRGPPNRVKSRITTKPPPGVFT
jgi:hypothetical protein